MNIKQTALKIAVITILAAVIAVMNSSFNVAEAKCGFDASTGEPVCTTDGSSGSGSGVTIVDEPPAHTKTDSSSGSSEKYGIEYNQGKENCGDVKTSILSNKNLCNSSDKNGIIISILIWVIRIMSVGVGIAAVGGVIFASILYTSAAGGSEQTKKAIQMFINITIGLLMWGLMVGLLNFIIPGGVFK